MKNKVTRALARDCHWLQTNWPKLICSTETDFHSLERQRLIRDHLAACDHCREEIESCFLPELWEAEPMPRGTSKDSILTGSVLERLEIGVASKKPFSPQPVPSGQVKVSKSRVLIPRIQPLLINFVTTAVIILALTYTGYFNLLPRLEYEVRILSNQVGTAFNQTQTHGVNGLKTILTNFEDTLKNVFIFQMK